MHASKLTVHAGEHARQNCPVWFPLEVPEADDTRAADVSGRFIDHVHPPQVEIE